jgi:tetratricopeptide (TPR) repeat protein
MGHGLEKLEALKITSESKGWQIPGKYSSVNYSGLNFVFLIKQRNMSFEKGLALYKEGKFEEALLCFNELISVNSGQAELHLYRGRILTRMGRGDSALADFDLLLSIEPYNTDYISDRGVVLHLLGRNEEALNELDRAANLDPKNPYRYSSRAFLKDRLGDFTGAIEDYGKAIELDPEDAIAYNNRGLIEEKMGSMARAKKNFEKADNLIGYNPESSGSMPPIGKTESKKRGPEMPDFSQTNPSKELSSKHFWDTLKGVFGDSETRKEFWEFVRRFFSGKKT